MVIWTIAKTTVGEAMRKKILNVFLLVAIAMIVLSLSFTQLGFKQDMTIVKGLGLFVILVAGLVISLILCVSLIPNEIERRTIHTILSKPVKRYEFLIGKYLGGLLTLLINVALMGTVFIIMVAVKAHFSSAVTGINPEHVPGGAGAVSGTIRPAAFDPSLVLGVILIYFQFFLLSAVVMLFSVFLTPTVNFFASAAVYIIGSAAPVWESLYAEKGGAGPFVKGFYKIIHTIIPNFDYFNIQNRLIHPTHEVRSMPLYVTETITYAVLFSVVVVLIAVLIFEKREV